MRWRSLYLALVCLTLAPLTWLANGSPFLKDAGELTSSLWNGGIAHPTGFALQHVLAGIWRTIPLGAASLRMSWLSALSAAFVVLFAGLAVNVLVRGKEGVRGATSIIGILAGTGLLLGDVAWFHTVNVEVYLPSLAVAALLVYLALRAVEEEDRRFWHLFCLAGGLGLGLHVTVVGVACIGAAGLIAGRLNKGSCTLGNNLRELFFPGVLFVLGGSLVVLYLPLRGITEPIRVWADVSTFQGLIGHLTGRSIRSSFAGTMLATGDASWVHLQVYSGQLLDMVGTWLPLAVVGAWATARRRPLVALLLLSWLVLDGVFAVFVNPMGLMEKQTSLLSLFILALLAGAGAGLVTDLVLSIRGPIRAFLVPAALCTVMALLLASPIRSLSPAERRSRAGDHGYGMVRGAFFGLGPDGLLVTSQDDLSALAIYFAEVERRRPDVVHLIKHFICDVPFRNGVGRRNPDGAIVGLWGEASSACAGGDGEEVLAAWRKFLPALATLAPPLRWELGDGELDRALQPLLVPNYPVFDVRWGLGEEERRFRTEAFVGQMRGSDKQLAAHFADDISRGVISEFYRLTGTFLLGSGLSESVRESDCEMLLASVRLDGGNCRGWNNLGVCRVLAGLLDEGLAACQSGREACPRYVRVRLSELRYLLQAGRYDEAQAALGELRENFSVDEWSEAVDGMREAATSSGASQALEVLREGPLSGQF